jgi:hypothetical protein
MKGINLDINIIYTSLLFLLVFIVGYWLRWSGAPYNSILLTIHKLVALGVSIYLAAELYQLQSGGAISSTQLLWGLISGALLLATGLIGGVVSLDRPTHKIFGWLHNILPYAAVGALSLFLTKLP